MISMRRFVMGLLILLLAACSSTPKTTQSCQELDWYEIGRQDGTKGKSLTDHDRVRVVCSNSDQSLAEALYYNGYDAGAAQYCTAQNGYELGRTGQKLNDVCPPFLRSAFMQKYEQGLRANQLAKQNEELDQKLKKIETSINDKTLDAAKKELLANEKIELVGKKQAIESEIRNLSENLN